MRLVNAEFLKLYRRYGLVIAALGIVVAPALVMLVVTGDGDYDKGGMRSFADQFGVVAVLSLVSGILVGATVGTADVSSGVFRDLVVTGRSRIDLYAARVPAGLLLVLAAAAAGFAIVVATAFLSAGTVPESFERFGTEAPESGLVLKAAAWLALTTTVGFALSFGVASVVGSPSGAVAILLGLWLVVTPVVQSFGEDNWLIDALVISGLDRVMPAGMVHGNPVERMSLTAGIAVLVAWTAIPLLAGAWRTMTRDA